MKYEKIRRHLFRSLNIEILVSKMISFQITLQISAKCPNQNITAQITGHILPEMEFSEINLTKNSSYYFSLCYSQSLLLVDFTQRDSLVWFTKIHTKKFLRNKKSRVYS